MPRSLPVFLIACLTFGLWLGYLSWLVSNRRPEPILETLGKDFWPSRSWMATAEALVEVRPAGDAFEVVGIFKSAEGAPSVGEMLPASMGKVIQERVGPEGFYSSWIVGLEKNPQGGAKGAWSLVGDPLVPGRRAGLPRMVPATPWARAWMPKG